MNVQLQRMSLRDRWFHLRYDLRRWWGDGLPRWVAWKLPRSVVLWAFVRVAAVSGKGPDELTYGQMHDDWHRKP